MILPRGRSVVRDLDQVGLRECIIRQLYFFPMVRSLLPSQLSFPSFSFPDPPWLWKLNLPPFIIPGSVFIAGSNPNPDVDITATFPSEYRTEKFYPWYYNHPRPQPTGLPSNLGYGGNYFDVRLSGASLSGLSKEAAAGSANAVIIRTGFSTHGINMGQRYLQLFVIVSLFSLLRFLTVLTPCAIPQ